MSEDDRGNQDDMRVVSRLGPILAALFSFLPLASCKPPIPCTPGHEAHEETLCPSCPTIDDPPPGYCPCTKGWVCRETEEHAAARREAQRSRPARR